MFTLGLVYVYTRFSHIYNIGWWILENVNAYIQDMGTWM